MGDGDADSSHALEVACPCLNVRVLVKQHNGGGDAATQVELDEAAQRAGGAVRVSHPRLVVEDTATRSRSKDKGKEKASSSLDTDDTDTPITVLRCLNCSSVLLSYPADGDSSPIAPKSKTGTFTMDLSPSSKLVKGTEKMAFLSNKDKNPDWSDLFRLVMPPSSSSSSSDDAGETANGRSDIDDGSDMVGGGGSSSSDTVESRRNVTADGTGDLASSPALRRTPSLKRTNSGSDNRNSLLGTSSFHSTARARIKRDRQDLEDKIARMRKEFGVQSKRYIEQADTLASRLKSAERTSKRNSSPSTSKTRSADQGDSSGSGDSSHVIVIRGGFDPPKSETVSPSGSHNAGVGSYRTPITSPHLATAGNFPALFSSMSGATVSSNLSAAGETVNTQEAKKDGIVQPTQPQSPTFRRSRSPSPSRDTSKGRSGSRDRAGGETRGESSKMERGPSDEQYNGNATTSKRPALNLMRDVSILEHDLQQKKADKSAEESRGRTTVAWGSTMPTHSVLRNKGQPTNVSSSYTSRGSVPRPRGTWLRLNGLSPSPPVDRLMLDRSVPQTEETSKEQGDDGDATSSNNQNKRESLSKHRHVSFKEPEPGSSVEASPAPVEAPLAEDLIVEEEDEVPFDMDEDIQHLADEGELDEEDAGFVNVEAPGDMGSTGAGETSGTVTRDTVAPGSVAKNTVSISLSGDRKTKAGDSLTALLNDPSSFIGSLKSRNYGAAMLSGRSSYDQDTGKSTSPLKDKVSLSDQAQKLRDLLALDAPSHRGTKSKRDKAMVSYLRDRSEDYKEDDINDDDLDSLAPVSALATSLPVTIGFHGVNKKTEYEFERKTSVPQRESMLVPRLYESGRHRASKPGQYSPYDRLTSLGEESESGAGSRPPSPGGVPGPVNTGTGDAFAAGNEENDETRDQLRALPSKDDGFMPPHVWKFKDRPVTAMDMLGTSVHDYE